MLRWFFRSNKAASTSYAADPAASATQKLAILSRSFSPPAHHQAGRLREAEARYREV